MNLSDKEPVSRRSFLKSLVKAGIWAALGLTGLKGALDAFASGRRKDTVWQIDPYLCIHCGRCGKSCILRPSAVKCVHAYDVCGYCDLCGAYFSQTARSYATGGENLLCPTTALKRTFIEDPFFQYTIDEKLCVGCAKCVAGCSSFGNGSLFLQIRHDRCANCNSCSASRECPAGAISRVDRRSPYILKKGAPRA
jgi:electron transport complex protein RnfB